MITSPILATSDPPTPTRTLPLSHLRLLSLVVAAALAIRLLVVAFVFRDTASPSGHFQQFGWEMGWVARSLALHQGFSSPFFPASGPTALVPSLYPWLLAKVFGVFGIDTAASALAILSFNSLCSALTCIPIYTQRSAHPER